MNKETIAIFRKTHGLTQYELADLLGTNLSNVSSYERGHTNVPNWFKTRFQKLVEEVGIDWNKEIPKGTRLVMSKKIKEEVQPQSLPIEMLEEALKEVQQSTPVEEIVTYEAVPETSRPASDHYHTGRIDVWAFADENFDLLECIGFHRINALKYVARFGKKKGYNHEDLDKAIVELQKLKELTQEVAT